MDGGSKGLDNSVRGGDYDRGAIRSRVDGAERGSRRENGERVPMREGILALYFPFGRVGYFIHVWLLDSDDCLFSSRTLDIDL